MSHRLIKQLTLDTLLSPFDVSSLSTPPQSKRAKISPKLLSDAILIQSSTNELLRHFWASLDLQEIERMERIAGSLERMIERIRGMEEGLGNDLNLFRDLMASSRRSINAALTKFSKVIK